MTRDDQGTAITHAALTGWPRCPECGDKIINPGAHAEPGGMKGTVSISWGRYGGFYVNARHPRTAVRVCLGWVALTYVGIEIDDLMRAYADKATS